MTLLAAASVEPVEPIATPRRWGRQAAAWSARPNHGLPGPRRRVSPPTLRPAWVAALGLGAFMAAALTIADPGVTWDEPAYLASAKLEMAWLSELPQRAADGTLASWVSADTLEAYWNFAPYSNPHPPFYKVLGGATWAVFHGWLGDHASFRLSAAALFGLLVAAVAWWGSCVAGAQAGWGAGLALALMPRVFGDAHFAATDMPLAAFWTCGALFFWRA
ncbi:MAG: hypothetical protein H0V09_02270, partial [Gemmatimonadetes bacterium]|nr:hypothetical protein [Gemmatimonadota bacterium]